MSWYRSIILTLFWLPLCLAQNSPWTAAPVPDDSSSFHFVILSDRTGSMRPGVFADAVNKVNLLRPAFVMSIGDLIDGYTEDDGVIRRQWTEFSRIVKKLAMPFCHVPGNHDISNEKLEREWMSRFGGTYSHFVYKDVLFLCLNTEELPSPKIGDDQVAYFRDVLHRHPYVRWTLVFMHRPLWDYEDQCGFQKIESLLQGRPFTVFSGHEHTYLKSERYGVRYFTLATTGGGSPMRGPEFGEFDHLVWVTMTAKGPVVANLDLGGIRDENVVTDADEALIRPLRSGGWMHAGGVVRSSDEFRTIPFALVLTNPAPVTLSVQGELSPVQNLHFSPASIDLQVPPGETVVLDMALSCESERSIARLEPVSIPLTGSFRRPGKPELALPATCPLHLDWIHPCRKLAGFRLDGDCREWADSLWIDVSHPQYVKEDWTWSGPDDGRFRFALARDGDEIFLALKADDDRFLFDASEMKSRQDRFDVYFQDFAFSVAPGKSARQPRISSERAIRAACRVKNGIMTVEAVIPVKNIPLNDSRFRMNIAYMDHDRPENTKPAVLWWRPPWDSELDYEDSGTFQLREDIINNQ